jgi:hypothetical protein
MHYKMLTQRNPFCHHVNTEKGMLIQHFVTQSYLVTTPPEASDYMTQSHPLLT